MLCEVKKKTSELVLRGSCKYLQALSIHSRTKVATWKRSLNNKLIIQVVQLYSSSSKQTLESQFIVE